MAALRFVRRLFWPAVVVGLLLAVTGLVEPVYVFAPLLGLLIFRVGTATLASFEHGAPHVPDGDPQPVDTRVERITYWCEGCGTELLLLVRGTQSPPRHCGERMSEHTEIARDALS